MFLAASLCAFSGCAGEDQAPSPSAPPLPAQGAEKAAVKDAPEFLDPHPEPRPPARNRAGAPEALPVAKDRPGDPAHSAEIRAGEKQETGGDARSTKPEPAFLTAGAGPKDGVRPATPKGRLLTLDECIEIAIQSNLSLHLSRINDRRSDISVREAWADYLPEFDAGIGHSNSRVRGMESGDGQTSIRGSVSQRSPYGTLARLSVEETRSKLSEAAGGVRLDISQPLWKGAGLDVGLLTIRSARIGRLISRGMLDLDAQQLIFNIRSGYTNIRRRLQDREVSLQSIRSASAFLDEVRARKKYGKDTKVESSNAEVQLASRKRDLIATDRQLADAYDRLKVLMGVALTEDIRVEPIVLDFGDKYEAVATKEIVIVPDGDAGLVKLVVTRPQGVLARQARAALTQQLDSAAPPLKPKEEKVLFQAQRIDADATLRAALDNRIDLLNRRRGLAVQRLQTLAAKDGLGQELNLDGGVGRNHVGRSLFEHENGGESLNWSVGLSARFPWGKVRDRAGYERALLDLQATEVQLKIARTQVQADVRDILRSLKEIEESLLIAGLQVEQAKLSKTATRSRADRGLNTSFEVIRSEEDLLRAKTSFVAGTFQYEVELARMKLVVGEPTGRVDLSGQSGGGAIDSKLPSALLERGLPDLLPDPEPRPEDDPHNKSREYREDYKPKKSIIIIGD